MKQLAAALGEQLEAGARTKSFNELGAMFFSHQIRRLSDVLSERVSVRALREILEAATLDPLPEAERALVEVIRARLARPLSHSLCTDGVLRAHALDPMIEEAIRDGLGPDGEPALDPELARDVLEAVRRGVSEAGAGSVLLTQPDVRAALRRLVAPELPDLPVLSYRELDPQIQVERLGLIRPGS